MNPLKNTIAINKVYRGFRKYLKNVPAIRAAQARGDHAEAQRIIRRGEDYFCDHTGASLGIKVDVINPENIPTEGPYLVVANHQSYADIYALIDAFRSTQIGFIAKSQTSCRCHTWNRVRIYRPRQSTRCNTNAQRNY